MSARTNVARLPTQWRLLAKLGLASGDLRAQLDTELRQVDEAIHALRARRQRVLIAYRREARRMQEIRDQARRDCQDPT